MTLARFFQIATLGTNGMTRREAGYTVTCNVTDLCGTLAFSRLCDLAAEVSGRSIACRHAAHSIMVDASLKMVS